MYRLVCAPPVLLCIRLAALDAGASPRTPRKQRESCSATDRLLCAPPCVCTAFCVHRQPLLQTALFVHRLVYVPPCVCTAGPTTHSARCARRGGQPPHPPKITRLLHCYRPPFVCTALCMYRLLCAPPTLETSVLNSPSQKYGGGPLTRPQSATGSWAGGGGHGHNMAIYYYTPLPLNLANTQQATTSTSPCCFDHCTFPTPRA